jgi:hypothetical protein
MPTSERGYCDCDVAIPFILLRVFTSAILVTFLACNASAAQNIVTVRVVNARNGKPLKGYRVWLQFHPAGETTLRKLDEDSDSDGIAHFELEEPLPETIHVALSQGDYRSASGEVKRLELLNSGVTLQIAPSLLGRKASHLSSRPGEVILFVRRWPWWARVLAPLERD